MTRVTCVYRPLVSKYFHRELLFTTILFTQWLQTKEQCCLTRRLGITFLVFQLDFDLSVVKLNSSSQQTICNLSCCLLSVSVSLRRVSSLRRTALCSRRPESEKVGWNESLRLKDIFM